MSGPKLASSDLKGGPINRICSPEGIPENVDKILRNEPMLNIKRVLKQTARYKKVKERSIKSLSLKYFF